MGTCARFSDTLLYGPPLVRTRPTDPSRNSGTSDAGMGLSLLQGRALTFLSVWSEVNSACISIGHHAFAPQAARAYVVAAGPFRHQMS